MTSDLGANVSSVAIQFILFAGLTVTAVFSFLGLRHGKEASAQATQANDAVNHRHQGEPRLFDMVVETHRKVEALDTWKDRWDGLPEELSDDHGLVRHFDKLQSSIEINRTVITDLVDHARNHSDQQFAVLHEQVVNVDGRLAQHIEDEEGQMDRLEDALNRLESTRPSGAEKES